MKIKKFAKIISIVAILTLVMASFCYADIFVGGRSNAFFKVYYDSSVSSYGYGPHYDVGLVNWHNISSKVSPTKTTSMSDYPDKCYIGTTTTVGLLGHTSLYKKNILGQIVSADTTDTWVYATVVMYHNTMADNNMTSTQVKGNATHEIGHTISLAHPTSTQSSIMNQGIQSIAPSTYDKNQLIAKWGI